MIDDPNPQAFADELTVEITYRGKRYGQRILVLRTLVTQAQPRDRPTVLAHALDRAIRPAVDKLLDDYTEKWICIPGSQPAPRPDR